MQYCILCLQPDTRPNIKFNADGICPACDYAATLPSVDWDQREKLLTELCDFGRKNKSWGYDCLIGVSGGKDSTRQALFVRDVLKMKPLLVSCMYPPEQISDRGARNVQNLISLGFNTITVGPAPRTWKHNMRKSFFEYGNWAKPTELALYASAPRVAIAWQVPLVFLGENPALLLGELGVKSEGYDGNQTRWMNTLNGGDPAWLFTDSLKEKDLLSYYYPSEREMERAKIQVVYLGYFWKVWSKKDNGMISALNGLDVHDEKPEVIGDILGCNALDEDFVVVNQLIKYFKFGFGRVTDIVNEQIRLGELTRDEGIKLVEKYDGKCSEEIINAFCHYLDITSEEFWGVVDSFTNKEIFEKDNDGKWKLKFPVGASHAKQDCYH